MSGLLRKGGIFVQTEQDWNLEPHGHIQEYLAAIDYCLASKGHLLDYASKLVDNIEEDGSFQVVNNHPHVVELASSCEPIKDREIIHG